MPLIHVAGPAPTDRAANLCRPDRIIADARAEVTRQHLCPKADAQKRLLLRQRHLAPRGLAMNEVIGVVGALRSAENDGAGMLSECLRQRIAETRTANVEGNTASGKVMAHAARARVLLVQHDQDGLCHGKGRRNSQFILLQPRNTTLYSLTLLAPIARPPAA